MFPQIGKFFRTTKHIKLIQFFYQIRIRIFQPKFQKDFHGLNKSLPVALSLIPFPGVKQNVTDGVRFTFLNKTQLFENEIDWNFEYFGKLWNYNLQYLDFINQEESFEQTRIKWILDLYLAIRDGKTKIEPYPVSLRSINVIRFLSAKSSRIVDNPEVVHGLYLELQYLHANYEYHLLGNHLLENAFSMLMGSFFFDHKIWKEKALRILQRELKEQILDDGSHFELSPMYHQIILWRLIEGLSYFPKYHPLGSYMKLKAELMMGWLEQMSFRNGDLPHFNDSADGIAFTTAQLLKSATQINLNPVETKLKESGYRKFKNGHWELIADVHGISPIYQPGHNHADHLSFILYVNDKPFIVDPGTSTYTISQRRQWERSSQAHNTVTVNNYNQSEVWGGFRVGRRAKVEILSETGLEVTAVIKYRTPKLNVRHTRGVSVSNKFVIIEDSLNNDIMSVARFYLHPNISLPEIRKKKVIFEEGIEINFENSVKITLVDYDFGAGFNKLLPSKCVEVCFKNRCKAVIALI